MKKKIALYGLSVETKKALKSLKTQYDIVGLLDGFRDSGEMYGMSIISLEECTELNVERIIVVARPGSCKAIYNRIESFCTEHDIRVFDIRGNALDVKKDVKFDTEGIKPITKSELITFINDADVVSFDFFDTLVTRKVLSYEDVLALVEKEAREVGYCIDNLSRKRLKAEKRLSQAGAPKLADIYFEALADDKEALSDCHYEVAERLARLEYEIDKRLIIPRYDMIEMLEYVKQNNKAAYITSDTYYSKEQLSGILTYCNIEECDGILASCEYGCSKSQGLYDVLKNMAASGNKNNKSGELRILHIGDDVYSDVECAEKSGIEIFKIYSGNEIFDKLGSLGLEEYEKNMSTRIKIGMFVANIFNSPFIYESDDQRLSVKSAFDIGYLFMAPMITDFTVWFRNKVFENDIKNVFLGARDGWLIKKLYDYLVNNNDSVYFYTSRIAAIRSGVENKSDIDYVADMKYSGSLKQQLSDRFGIDIEPGQDDTIYDYADLIIENSRRIRKNQQKYFDSLNIIHGDIAFFDFVAKGTTQMYLKRFISNHIKGLYFMQLEKGYMTDKNIDVESFFEMIGDENRTIYEDYYILETVLTSVEPSVGEFDEYGNPVFLEETRTDQSIKCIEEIQRGIESYFKEYVDIYFRSIDEQGDEIHTFDSSVCYEDMLVNEDFDKKLDEAFLRLIHSFKITNEDFLNFCVEDKFFNRMTDMKLLI